MIRRLVLVMGLTLVLIGMLGVAVKVQRVEASGTIKAGDWIKYEVIITGRLPGEIIPTWVKLDFLSVEETNATVRATMHLSDGTENINTTTVDIASGTDTGFIIPSNSKTGDSIYISGYENITIDGETTLTYTGVNRTVVYASFSDSGDHFAYYWDKQTGIMLEQRKTSNSTTTIFRVKETNMWQTQPSELLLDPTVFYVMIIVVAIVVAVMFLRTRKKKKPRRRTRRKRR